MRHQTARTLIAAIALIATAGIAVACDGGGGALTVEEYLKEIERLGDEGDAGSAEISADFDEALESAKTQEDAVQAYRDLFSGTQGVLATFVADLDALNPPDEVEELHREGVEAYRDTIALLGDVDAELADATTSADIEAVFTEFGSAEPVLRVNEVCAELQALAEENDVDVQLDCEGEG